ncbi:hypothetical protein ACEPPN_013901 [Leptodophora sp. 'Broadleaf-Isolate-01']
MSKAGGGLGTECVYEPKEKPGLKGGAVENLNRRVEKLEDLLEHLQEHSRIDSRISGTGSTSPTFDRNSISASALLRSFERELRKFNDASSSIDATNQDVSYFASTSVSNRKRKRLDDSTEGFDWGIHLLGQVSDADDDHLPCTNLLQGVVSNYFSQVHPWIPMIHEISFRKQFSEQVHQANLEVILHAMIVAALRFTCGNGKITFKNALETTRTSRDWVILNATKSLSVENLQALTIVAFNDVGSCTGFDASYDFD